jgi:hypothetical protein
MSIEELLSCVPAPSAPVDSGSPEAWDATQKKLGISLPTDYMDFGIRYGTGLLYDPNGAVINILNPFSVTYTDQVASESHGLATVRRRVPDGLPYGIYPEVPGLLFWGSDYNGFGLYWLTEGTPDKWPIIVKFPRQHSDFQEFNLSLTSFMAGCLTRRITCVAWDYSLSSSEPSRIVFQPRKS